MRGLLVILALMTLCSCQRDTGRATVSEFIPEVFILKSNTSIIGNQICVDSVPVSGYIFGLNLQSSDTVLKQTVLKGYKEGFSKKWYPNGQLKEIRHYSKGQKHGKQIAFWENGHKRFEYSAVNDVYEGELKEWDMDGNLLHVGHYKNGLEEGSQQLWYANGKIRANYVIKAGKRYGLLGTKNCTNVSDSIYIDR